MTWVTLVAYGPRCSPYFLLFFFTFSFFVIGKRSTAAVAPYRAVEGVRWMSSVTYRFTQTIVSGLGPKGIRGGGWETLSRERCSSEGPTTICEPWYINVGSGTRMQGLLTLTGSHAEYLPSIFNYIQEIAGHNLLKVTGRYR